MTTSVRRVPAGGPWGSRVGYSRAVRSGALVCVSGSTGVHDGALVGAGDTAAQARRAVRTVLDALGALGAGAADVVQTRIYMVDADEWPLVAEVHREAFGAHAPAATLVQVARLISPELRVEIEAMAWVHGPDGCGDAPATHDDASADYITRR